MDVCIIIKATTVVTTYSLPPRVVKNNAEIIYNIPHFEYKHLDNFFVEDRQYKIKNENTVITYAENIPLYGLSDPVYPLNK